VYRRTTARLISPPVEAVAKPSDSELDAIAADAAELTAGYPTFS
jgi:hypothetical protein